MNSFSHILLSRTDSIGDVVLTLPMAGVIKEHYPNCKISFLGKTYTKDIISLSKYVDEFVNYDDLLALNLKQQITYIKRLNIDVVIHVFPVKQIAHLFNNSNVPIRIGTKSRLYNWFTCNKLITLKRKNSNFHEAQLNIKLLSKIGIMFNKPLCEIQNYYGFDKIPILEEKHKTLIDASKINIILHPKSKGSAREWGEANYIKLINDLPTEKYKIFISGSKDEALLMPELINNPNVTSVSGLFNLQQFIAFINVADVLIAASTGPLHIAAALNKKAIGLFSPMRPIFPTRWAPLGKNVSVIVKKQICVNCLKNNSCECIKSISTEEVIKEIENGN